MENLSEPPGDPIHDHPDAASESSLAESPGAEKQSILAVMVHSFFVIPFLIAVFAVLIYFVIRILTMEQHTTYDYLNDVKTGGSTKRWQSAFELSRILANPELVPKDERFVNELIAAFKQSEHDDDRVRQYLALAMGRTENPRFVEPLLDALARDKDENRPAIIHSLGNIRDERAAPYLHPFVSNGDERIRLVTVIALGDIGDSRSLDVLKTALHDPEVNVEWDAAIALAKMRNPAGRDVLKNLLNRDYLSKFPEVNAAEQNQAMMVAIEAAVMLHDPELDAAIRKLGSGDLNIGVRRAAMDAVK